MKHRIGLIVLALLLPSLGWAQAVPATFNAFIDPDCNCRQSNPPNDGVNLSPVFDTLPGTANFTRNQIASFDLAPYCNDDGASRIFSKVFGSYPTGLTLSGSIIGGTPTVAETQTITLRCTDDGSPALFDEQNIDLAVADIPPPDTTPDSFGFAPQTAVPTGTLITSNAVVISGINAAAACSVINGTWSKNSGTFGSASGTVVAGDAVQVKHQSSGANSVTTLTTLTCGGVTGSFTSITVASGAARVGVFYRSTATALAGMIDVGHDVNPEKAEWASFAPEASDTDGGKLSHIAQSDNNLGVNGPAIRALPHVVIAQNGATIGSSTSVQGCDSDGTFFIYTLYPKWTNAGHTTTFSPPVVYDEINGNLGDKPRINFINTAAAKALSDANAAYYHRRVGQWIAWCDFLPANYIEDTDSARDTMMQVVGGGDNDWDMAIVGGGGGANIKIERKRRAPSGGAWTSVSGFSTPITDDMKGGWIAHILYTDIDNRLTSAGGSPVFKWWVCKGVNLDVCTLVANDTTTAYGSDDTNEGRGWYLQWNHYKGSWHGHGAPGAYTGNVFVPISIGKDALRIGDATSSFQDVHPRRVAEP